jgi:hypothetical protein
LEVAVSIVQFAAAGVVLTVCSALQSAVGFAFNLAAVPLLLLLGFSLPDTVTVVIVASLVQRTMAVYHLRHAVDWRELGPMVVVAVASLPLGITLMDRLAGLGPGVVKQCVGGAILAILLVQWLASVKPREAVATWWGYFASFLSGILYGIAAIGGPPIVLWILAHRWSGEKMRVTTLAYSLPITPFLLAFLIMTFGTSLVSTILWGFGFFPFVFGGTWLGLYVGNRLSAERLRVVAKILLIAIAVAALVRPFFGGD